MAMIEGEGSSRRSQLGTQNSARIKAHGGVAGGRSHGRGLGVGTEDAISCDRANRFGDLEGAEETWSQGDTAGLEGQGGADGSRD